MTTATFVSSLCVRVMLVITLWTLSVTTVVAAADVIDIPKWIVPYGGEQNITATVGDTLTFEWDATLYGPHDVYIHPTMDCDVAGAIYVGETSPTSYVLTEQDGTPDGNPLFFSCDVGDGAHCTLLVLHRRQSREQKKCIYRSPSTRTRNPSRTNTFDFVCFRSFLITLLFFWNNPAFTKRQLRYVQRKRTRNEPKQTNKNRIHVMLTEGTKKKKHGGDTF